ncbi:pantoate--beta-alanine ligase [Liquorilactobacillus satsumensis]|uniref:pantoate--beta-alanine ligase n=1 Tax=Liquorilactobacillus TaxID=2767888 RepID=UPI0021C34A22|nr:pantoate--beta-alanine ligase [Liquorilactobacillus satsumensis]MCP9313881.1 pantoate--beta-alanine ligase [Liquorilactobacillus satsumensis]MCP9361022.1 pantoate--beta-alanine ligase [Liquorilactobacillus satsumensis]
MQLITTIENLQTILSSWHQKNEQIALVPTMGYLHEGHQSLIRTAHQQNAHVVVSDFVNPTQFAPEEDLEKYPRDLQQDQQKAAEAGADILFAPNVAELYPDKFNTYVKVDDVTKVLEGDRRPIHFQGVTTIVTKLINLVQPQNIYFGQKDAQQVVVIKKMVRDLNIPVKVKVCPIVREKDGLAKSSRNVYLSAKERQAAVSLSQALRIAETALKDGQHTASEIIRIIKHRLNAEPLAQIDYVSVVDAQTLISLDRIEQPALILLAVRIGETRLIDNLLWQEGIC